MNSQSDEPRREMPCDQTTRFESSYVDESSTIRCWDLFCCYNYIYMYMI